MRLRVHVRPSLDLFVNIGILITCAIVVTAILRQRAANSLQAERTTAPAFDAGARAEDLPGVRYADASATLVLYLRSTCPYCTASMPFYGRLIERAVHDGARAVVTGSEGRDALDGYLKMHQLRVDQVVTRPGEPIPTPTLVLVDRAGRIIRVWVGQQKAEGEEDILRTMTAQARAVRNVSSVSGIGPS